jgi:hypothetical protein
MARLTLDQVEDFAQRFYGGEGRVGDVSQNYSREEIIAFIRDNIAHLCAEVEGMSSEQLAYRLPGAPSGPDESGDEEHFDTSQIMTHMASGTAFHWWNITRALRHDRPPMPKPPEGVTITGKNKNGMGRGGWQGIPAPQLCEMVRDSSEGLIDYVKQLPLDTGDARSSFSFFNNLSPHDWLFVVAIHAGMHLKQVRNMKSRPDFPRSPHLTG